MVDPEVLVEVPLFQTLSLNERKRLAGVMREQTLPPERILFEVGDPGTAMYIIRSGKIKISIAGDSGEELTLATLGPGAFFGEIALLDQQPRSARATAVGETVLYALEREGFLSFVGSRPDAALSMLSATAKRLRETDDIMRSRVSFDVNAEFARHETRGGRWAARLAEFAGSWTFISIYLGVLAAWFALNIALQRFGSEAVDTPAYELLGLGLGIVASFQAPIIMMSQNRDQLRDRLQADADFKVNQKNELAIEKAVERLEEMRRQIPELKRQIKEHETVVKKTFDQLKKAMVRGGLVAAAPEAARADAGAAPPYAAAAALGGSDAATSVGTGSSAGGDTATAPIPFTPEVAPAGLGEDLVVGEGTAIYMPGDARLDESGERRAAGSGRLRPAPAAGAPASARPEPARAAPPARAPAVRDLRDAEVGAETARIPIGGLDDDTPDPDADGDDDEGAGEATERDPGRAVGPVAAPGARSGTGGTAGSDTLKGTGSFADALKAFRPSDA